MVRQIFKNFCSICCKIFKVCLTILGQYVWKANIKSSLWDLIIPYLLPRYTECKFKKVVKKKIYYLEKSITPKQNIHTTCSVLTELGKIFLPALQKICKNLWFLIVVFNDYFERMISTIFALLINTKGTTVDKIRNSFNLKLHNLLGFCK